MANDTRPSLKKDLLSRYETQPVGGTFKVKDVLNDPNRSPIKGSVYDAKSSNGQAFQTPNGFELGMIDTQMKVIDSNGTAGVSKFVRGLDSRKYKR